MADTALASMTAATTLGGTELIYGTQSSADVKITATQIKTLAIGAGSVSVASGKTLTGSNSLTLAGTDGKTLTVSNSITLAGTDSTTMTFPAVSASLGYLGVPQNSKSAAYTTVLADAGTHILHPSADTTARIFTIDANATVAYPVGTVLTFINQNAGGVITIKITTDTMRLAGAGTTGDRTLAANGIATAIKVASTEWLISGTGLT
jgi:hypothetical protein